MRKRGIVSIVILTIITCGIYMFVAMYQIYSDVNYAARETDTALTDVKYRYLWLMVFVLLLQIFQKAFRFRG